MGEGGRWTAAQVEDEEAELRIDAGEVEQLSDGGVEGLEKEVIDEGEGDA